MARGIVRYVELHPPPGSQVSYWAKRAEKRRAAERDGLAVSANGKRRHIIQPGDSLSEVAALYGISTKSLRLANALASDRIKVGQVLTIPLP